MSSADKPDLSDECRVGDADPEIMRLAIRDQEQQIQSLARTLDRLRSDILRRDEQLAALRHLNSQLTDELRAALTSTSRRAVGSVRIVLGRSRRLARTAARRLAKLVWWTVTLQLRTRLRDRRARQK
jgi:hypothetical protein